MHVHIFHVKEVRATRTVVMANEDSHCLLNAWKEPSQKARGFMRLDIGAPCQQEENRSRPFDAGVINSPVLYVVQVQRQIQSLPCSTKLVLIPKLLGGTGSQHS